MIVRRALITATPRLPRTPDGRLWTRSHVAYDFWTRYLDVYEQATLLVRTLPVLVPPSGSTEVTGPGVDSVGLPDLHSPADLWRIPGLLRRIVTTLREPVALHLRVPCAIGSIVARKVEPGRPYGLEVVGDPWDAFAPGGSGGPLTRPVLRVALTHELRRQCRRARAVSYVTATHLQRRYPPSPQAFSTSFSSVQLGAEWFAAGPHALAGADDTRLVFVGSLANRYKGLDVLLGAMSILRRRRIGTRLVVVGDGRQRSSFEALAARLGLSTTASFVGQVSYGKPIRDILDRADLFVLPSRADGLPRSLLEAMARALPCIASRVGGIPELLPDSCLVEPGDELGLATALETVCRNPALQLQLARQNLDRALEFREETISQRRIEFYEHVRAESATWIERQHRSRVDGRTEGRAVRRVLSKPERPARLDRDP